MNAQKAIKVRSCTPFSEDRPSEINFICLKQNCGDFVNHIRAIDFLEKRKRTEKHLSIQEKSLIREQTAFPFFA